MDTYAAASTIYHFFNTHKADGTPITLAGTPGIDIYKDNGTTQDADDSGLTLTVDFDGVTGLHLVAIDTSSDGTFYATGHVFNVVLSAGTVDSVSVVGTTVYQFKLGEVPADVAKISGDSTAADNLEDFYEETTAIGNLIDMFDGTGYAGGTIKLATDATLNATQGSYAPAKAGDAMDLIADAIKKTTFDESTAFPVLSADTGATALARTGADSDTLKTLSDQIDGAALEATLTAIKGAGWSTETLAAIDALIDAVKAKTDLIPASPAAVGSAMTLTAAYDVAKTAAQAGDKMDIVDAPNSTAVTAIQAGLAKPSDIPSAGSVADAVLDEALGSHTGFLTGLLTAAGYTAPPSAGDIANAVWGAVTRSLTDKADFGLSTAGILAIWHQLLASIATAGSIGKLIKDNLDAKVSEVGGGSLTAESIRIEMDANSKLANLPADPADESSIEAAITAAHATTDALISAITGGGLTEKTYTLTDASTGLPLVGVQVWATTDEAGLNQVDITRATNDAGQVTFRFNLPAGTPIYIWNRYMVEGDAPDEEEV